MGKCDSISTSLWGLIYLYLQSNIKSSQKTRSYYTVTLLFIIVWFQSSKIHTCTEYKRGGNILQYKQWEFMVIAFNFLSSLFPQAVVMCLWYIAMMERLRPPVSGKWTPGDRGYPGQKFLKSARFLCYSAAALQMVLSLVRKCTLGSDP